MDAYVIYKLYVIAEKKATSEEQVMTTDPWSGFVQVLEVLESSWNSSLVFQGLEILEKQHFFGQGA